MDRFAFRKKVKAVLPPGVLLVLLAILYFPILKDLVRDWWTDPNYSHGFLIPFVSGYIIWQKRKTWVQLQPQPSAAGLMLLVFGLAALCVGTVGAELFTMRSSLIFVIAGLVLLNYGTAFLRAVFFPLVLLFFMIPLPYLIYDAVAFPLKLFVAQVATLSLQMIGVPILREGNIITLPQTVLEIADACSGMRSLMSLIALSVVFAYFSPLGRWQKVLLVLGSIPIAIATNALRILVTGILAHFVSPELAQGFFHEFSGWLVFIVAFVLLFCLGGLLGRASRGE